MTRHLSNHVEKLLSELRSLGSPQDEMKVLKRLRLRLKDRIAAIERSNHVKHGGPSLT